MNSENEIGKAICRTLVEIAQREKKKAIQKEDYENALIASFIEGLFGQAERSFQ